MQRLVSHRRQTFRDNHSLIQQLEFLRKFEGRVTPTNQRQVIEVLSRARAAREMLVQLRRLGTIEDLKRKLPYDFRIAEKPSRFGEDVAALFRRVLRGEKKMPQLPEFCKMFKIQKSKAEPFFKALVLCRDMLKTEGYPGIKAIAIIGSPARKSIAVLTPGLSTFQDSSGAVARLRSSTIELVVIFKDNAFREFIRRETKRWKTPGNNDDKAAKEERKSHTVPELQINGFRMGLSSLKEFKHPGHRILLALALALPLDKMPVVTWDTIGDERIQKYLANRVKREFMHLPTTVSGGMQWSLANGKIRETYAGFKTISPVIFCEEKEFWEKEMTQEGTQTFMAAEIIPLYQEEGLLNKAKDMAIAETRKKKTIPVMEARGIMIKEEIKRYKNEFGVLGKNAREFDRLESLLLQNINRTDKEIVDMVNSELTSVINQMYPNAEASSPLISMLDHVTLSELRNPQSRFHLVVRNKEAALIIGSKEALDWFGRLTLLFMLQSKTLSAIGLSAGEFAEITKIHEEEARKVMAYLARKKMIRSKTIGNEDYFFVSGTAYLNFQPVYKQIEPKKSGGHITPFWHLTSILF